MEFHGTNLWFCDGAPATVGQTCPDGNPAKQLVEQRIYRKSSTETVDWIDVDAGYMGYHAAEGHEHPHIDSWVHNSLRIKGRDTDNPLSWPLVSNGNKVSFCAENSAQCTGGTMMFL